MLRGMNDYGVIDFPEWTDRSTVTLQREKDILYWTATLGATVYEIRDAIQELQTRSAAALRAHFRRAA